MCLNFRPPIRRVHQTTITTKKKKKISHTQKITHKKHTQNTQNKKTKNKKYTHKTHREKTYTHKNHSHTPFYQTPKIDYSKHTLSTKTDCQLRSIEIVRGEMLLDSHVQWRKTGADCERNCVGFVWITGSLPLGSTFGPKSWCTSRRKRGRNTKSKEKGKSKNGIRSGRNILGAYTPAAPYTSDK